MNKTALSIYLEQYLIANHPLFIGNINYDTNGSFYCSLRSPTGKFSVWIATFNDEVSIGMDDPGHTSGCHTHMSMYDDDFEGQAIYLSEYLEQIFSDKLIFIHSSLSDFTWTGDLVRTLMEKEENETIEFFSWTGKV